MHLCQHNLGNEHDDILFLWAQVSDQAVIALKLCFEVLQVIASRSWLHNLSKSSLSSDSCSLELKVMLRDPRQSQWIWKSSASKDTDHNASKKQV